VFGHFGNRHYLAPVEVRRQRVDLVSLVRRAYDEICARPEARDRNMTFECNVPWKYVDTDREHVEYVVLNLLHNAAKYSDPGATVRLGLEVCAERSSIEVVDTGIGIPPEALERLGTPLFRAPNALSRPGSGLGLAVVKQSSLALGGSFSIKSALGQGTRVVVTLPH
jgi:signal transduction histidine kinase